MAEDDHIQEKKVVLPGNGFSIDDLARMAGELRAGQPLSANAPLLNERPMNIEQASVSLPNFQAMQQDIQSGTTEEKPNVEGGHRQGISSSMRQWLRNPQ